MTSTYNPGVHKFAVFVVCWTILLFVAGALVTSRDAALSVPTWPGPVMPPMVGGVFYEHSHRMIAGRSEEHTSELQSLAYLVCRLLLEKKKETQKYIVYLNSY